jgi:WD40 repeat protein
LAISNDDSFIVSGHLDGTIKLWSSNEKPEKIIDLHEDKITSLEILKNENLMLSISK